MKVNVILITYNHSECIAQALESILIQETAHEVEIIVADDCSTDDTLDIIKRHKNNSDFRYVYLEQTSNLGFVKNYQRAFKACNGDYVLIMEGDDYWTTANHIEQHVSFLEKHSECSMSYNRHLRVFVDQNREEVFEWTAEKEYEYVTTEQLTLGNRIGNLSCCAFRGQLIKAIDPALFSVNIADWMLGMYMGQFGNLAYLKDVTSAYRIHDKGLWSQLNEEAQFKKVLDLIDIYDNYFKYKYKEYFDKHRKRLNILLYGDKSLKGRIKEITPTFLRNLYRKIIH